MFRIRTAVATAAVSLAAVVGFAGSAQAAPLAGNFTQSNFTQSNFTQSNFTQSNFTQSNFTQSNFTQSVLPLWAQAGLLG